MVQFDSYHTLFMNKTSLQYLYQDLLCHYILKNIIDILAEYDTKYELYSSYNQKLLDLLKIVCSKSTIPISSISSKLLSRGVLRNQLLAKEKEYDVLDDVGNMISLRIILFFPDDINIFYCRH